MPTIVNFVKRIFGITEDSVRWDFGDGTTSTVMDQTVQHTYEIPGNYTVSLEAWNDEVSWHGKKVKLITIPTLTTTTTAPTTTTTTTTTTTAPTTTTTTTTLPPEMPRGWWKGEYNNYDSIAGNHAYWWGNPEWDSNGYINACFKTYSENYNSLKSHLVISLNPYPFNEINLNIEAYVKYDQTVGGRNFSINIITENNLNLIIGNSLGHGISGFGALVRKFWGEMDDEREVYQLYPSLTISPDNNWHKYQLIDNKSGRTELYIDDIKQTPLEYYDHVFNDYSLCYFENSDPNSSARVYCFFDEIKVW